MQTELIIVSEYCQKCHIEPSFIEMLEEGGLINVRTEAGKHYLLVSELPNVERYSRMYYDLSINMEGIDAIHHMLERMDDMRREITSLRKPDRSFPFPQSMQQSGKVDHIPGSPAAEDP